MGGPGSGRKGKDKSELRSKYREQKKLVKVFRKAEGPEANHARLLVRNRVQKAKVAVIRKKK